MSEQKKHQVAQTVVELEQSNYRNCKAIAVQTMYVTDYCWWHQTFSQRWFSQKQPTYRQSRCVQSMYRPQLCKTTLFGKRPNAPRLSDPVFNYAFQMTEMFIYCSKDGQNLYKKVNWSLKLKKFRKAHSVHSPNSGKIQRVCVQKFQKSRNIKSLHCEIDKKTTSLSLLGRTFNSVGFRLSRSHENHVVELSPC